MDSRIRIIIFFYLNRTIQLNETEREYNESAHNYFSLLRSKWCNTILTTILLFIKKVNHPEKLLLFENSYTVKIVYLLIVTPQHWWDTVVVWKENICLNLWSCSLRPWEFEVWLQIPNKRGTPDQSCLLTWDWISPDPSQCGLQNWEQSDWNVVEGKPGLAAESKTSRTEPENWATYIQCIRDHVQFQSA